MKKRNRIGLMAITFITVINATAQPSSHDDEIMRIRGKWTKHANIISLNDASFLRKDYPFVYLKTDSIAGLIKQMYPSPTGLQAVYYTSVGSWPVFEGAPASYTLASFYSSYYFNKNLNKILLASETSTWLRVYVNSFGLLLRSEGKWMVDGQQTEIFVMPAVNGKWKGLPVYRNFGWKPGNKIRDTTNMVLLTHDGKLPYTNMSQWQYLHALKHFLKGKIQEVQSTPAQSDKEYQKSINSIKNNQYISAADKEKMLANMQKTYEQLKQSGATSNQKITEQFDKKIAIIDQYLATHTQKEMQQPAATSMLWDFPGYFGADGKKEVIYPLRAEPSYFKKNLPRHIPQFMVVEWNSEKDAPGLNFKREFEDNFSVEKLAAMLDHRGNETIIKPVYAKTDPATDAELKAIRKRAEKYADSMLALKKSMMPGVIPSVLNNLPVDSSVTYSISPRNEKLLAAIPKKTLTSAELKTYITEVGKKYTALLAGSGVKLPDISNLSIGEITYASALYLTNGMSEQAAWTAIKAVEKHPDNVLVLSNSGAVLNACGFQPVAVPVLESALKKVPGNSAIQNNLGQAYVALGDMAKAIPQLEQAVANNPYHPFANLSLAYINHSRGNKTNALKYVENSLYGSFTDGAWHLLHKLKPSARLITYLKHRYRPPDYFNENKYRLPRQCEKVEEIGLLKGEYTAFREMAMKTKREFEAIEKEESQLAGPAMMQRVKDYKNSGIMHTPFTELGSAMLLDIQQQMSEDFERIGRAQHIYNKEMSELTNAYRKAYATASGCDEQIGLSNRYMPLMAYVTKEYQDIWMRYWNTFFNDITFWSSFACPEKHLQRAVYAGYVRSYLAEVLRVAETHFLETTTDCNNGQEIKKEAEELKIEKPDCPIDIDINAAIGSFNIDCEKIEFHFGASLVADVTHSFKNHRTIIAIGAGLELKYGGEKLKAGPIQGGFGATGKMQYFLTFDGTHPADQGLIWEISMKYKQKINTGIDDFEKLESIQTTGINLTSNTTLSLHNGWTFDGSIYKHLDKILPVIF